MNRVLRLPARYCAHFLLGRCLYEERLNPGYHQGYRCLVLLRAQSDFDAFLTRAEAFGLSDAAASGLWEKQMDRFRAADCGCQEYEPGDTTVFPGCIHCTGDVCVKRLPECGGRCPEFTPNKQE
jgi:hypothetical protein